MGKAIDRVELAFNNLAAAERGFIGIDPGQLGGLFFLHAVHRTGKPQGFAVRWKDLALPELAEFMRGVRPKTVYAALEVLGAINRVDQDGGSGGQAGNINTVHKLADNGGIWRYALAAEKFRHEGVRPQTWQKAVAPTVRARKLAKAEHKKELAAHARLLLPDTTLTKDECDMALLSIYAAKQAGYTLAQLSGFGLAAELGISEQGRQLGPQTDEPERGADRSVSRSRRRASDQA